MTSISVLLCLNFLVELDHDFLGNLLLIFGDVYGSRDPLPVIDEIAVIPL